MITLNVWSDLLSCGATNKSKPERQEERNIEYIKTSMNWSKLVLCRSRLLICWFCCLYSSFPRGIQTSLQNSWIKLRSKIKKYPHFYHTTAKQLLSFPTASSKLLIIWIIIIFFFSWLINSTLSSWLYKSPLQHVLKLFYKPTIVFAFRSTSLLHHQS